MRKKRRTTAVASDTAVVDKLSGIISAAQVRHNELVREMAVLQSKVALLNGLVDGLLAGPGCDGCQRGWVDDVDMMTGEVLVRRCPRCN